MICVLLMGLVTTTITVSGYLLVLPLLGIRKLKESISLPKDYKRELSYEA